MDSICMNQGQEVSSLILFDHVWKGCAVHLGISCLLYSSSLVTNELYVLKFALLKIVI